MPELPRRYRNLDHLILGTPSLEKTVALLRDRVGVDPYFGGSHPKHGTSNYLLPIGGRTYLEIIGTSAPEAELDDVGRQFVSLPGPRLIGVALETNDISETLAAAKQQHLPMDAPEPGARVTPDGTLLQWEGVYFDRARFGRILFFAIDWKHTPHPSQANSRPAGLTDFEVRSDSSQLVAAYCRLLKADIPVAQSAGEMSLHARIAGPSGSLDLSSERDPL